MRFFHLLSFFVVFTFAQRQQPFSPQLLQEVKEVWVDDYGDYYFANSQKFSVTKYDSLGEQKAEFFSSIPFQLLSVTNPLAIPIFSEVKQELSFIDQNLNFLKEKINFSEAFFHVKSVFVEDWQYLWVIDEVQKKIVKYDYQNQAIVKSYFYNASLQGLKNFVVWKDTVYLIKDQLFEVYHLNKGLQLSQSIPKLEKVKRDAQGVFLYSQNSIYQYTEDKGVDLIFEIKGASSVTDNYKDRFAIQDNKLYLYTSKK
ncbi:hypothetical protein [Elizabethkingia sp. JS20170427COW]|uniref:hypothetical protein n=1 Tax=Elizabethkingia sp. JS20170427COW TaxID=2583851 RepID=UPI0011101B75|nr:hypothetical protein [Elizabethkingia sp. JS20170427COW]QCX53945.1 hypothetical protein FGE20_09470 [Elizabethkingia sp. JS20170427COW]